MRARIAAIVTWDVAWALAGGCAAAPSSPAPLPPAPAMNAAPAPAGPAAPATATDIAWGGSFCALRSDGRVACWGPDPGALGDGSLEARSTPTLVPGLDSVVRLRAYPWKGLCALRADRSLWCWGFGNATGGLPPTRVLDDVVDFAFSDDQYALSHMAGSVPGVCARRGDGSVRCVQFHVSDSSTRQGPCRYWSDAAHSRCLNARFAIDVVGAPFLDNGDVQIGESGNVRPSTLYHRPCILLGRQVYCRGSNELGQLGDPTLRESRAFVAVPGMNDAVSLTGWAQTSCAVKASGQVVCWGRNDGDIRVPADAKPCVWVSSGGTKQACTRRPTAMPVTDAVQIEHGRLLAILTRAGDVMVSGLPYVRGPRTPMDAFVKVPGLPPLARIELGLYGLCGLTAAGDVACYGYASELGDGAPWIDRVPKPVANLTGVTMVRVGRHGGACAVRGDGSNTCWGTYNVPQGLPPVTIFGDDCALARDGRVWCWGFNGSGEMGLGYQYRDGLRKEPKGDYWAITDTPLPVPRLADVVDLATLSSRRCALERSGAVRCWGYFVPPRMFTWKPTLIEGLPPVKQMAMAGLELVALARDGSVWNIASGHPSGVQITRVEAGPILMLGTHAAEPPGQNSRGQPDRCLVTADRSLRCSGGPAPVTHPGPVAQLSVDEHRGCAVLTDGRLICWGRPYCAEKSKSYCRGTVWNQIDTVLDRVSQVSVGENYACAVRTDGTVWCWGNALPAPEGGAQITEARTSRVDLSAAR